MSEGWVKTWRSITEWEHYEDITTFKLFFHLLLKANVKPRRKYNQIIPRGSLDVKVRLIGDECGLTYQEVKTSMRKLLDTGEITKIATNKYTIINVVNYEVYQGDDQGANAQLTHNQRTINALSTHIVLRKKERKKERKDNTVHLADDTTQNPNDLEPDQNPKQPGKQEIDAFFELVWKHYPSKKGKGQVKETQKKRLFAIGFDALKLAIERYVRHKPDWQDYQNGSTFFNSGYVDYLDENYVDPIAEAQQLESNIDEDEYKRLVRMSEANTRAVK